MNEIESVGQGVLLTSPAEPGPVRHERPWLFAFLIAPVAILANGLAGGVLSYLFRQHGVPIERASAILALLVLPQTIYFLWSPITDLFVRRRTWMMMGAVAAGGMIALAFQQPDLSATRAVAMMFLGACCGQLVTSSCGGMMGTLHGERRRLVASSAFQAGSLAFGAMAILVLTTLSQRMTLGMLGCAAGGMIAVPALAAFGSPEQKRVSEETLGHTLAAIGREFKAAFLCWRAVPYIAVATFPMASGAAIGLLPGAAQDYGVSTAHMAWMNGAGGAFLTGGGALAATLITPRVRATVSYLVCALVNVMVLGVLWLGPMKPGTYYLGATLYLFTIGTCCAMYTAVSLEFMGKSGKSGSSRYSIYNSMGNVPVAYMTALDGLGAKHWGTRGLAGTEAVLGGVGGTLLLLYFLARKGAVAAAGEAAIPG